VTGKVSSHILYILPQIYLLFAAFCRPVAQKLLSPKSFSRKIVAARLILQVL